VEIGELARLAECPTGVYLFYSPGEGLLQYVGKATSRSFIDRIPAHFDPRESAWMNSFPKHIAKDQNCSYEVALSRALDHELLVRGTSSLPGGKVEAVLRAHLRPALNATNRAIEASLTLEQACGL